MNNFNPMACPRCQGEMRIIAFLTDYAVVDRIIAHLKLTFVAERPPPLYVVSQEFLMDSEASADFRSFLSSLRLMRRFGPPGAASHGP